MADTERNPSHLAKPMKRSNKPLMEKRRRGRINNCLDQLKELVLGASKQNTGQYNKLEKADILEMTVRHLQVNQTRHLAVAASADSSLLHNYRQGFQQCAAEVGRYLAAMDGLGEDVRSRLMHHLSGCLHPAPSRKTSPLPQTHVAPATPPYSLPGSPVQQSVLLSVNTPQNSYHVAQGSSPLHLSYILTPSASPVSRTPSPVVNSRSNPSSPVRTLSIETNRCVQQCTPPSGHFQKHALEVDIKPVWRPW